MLYLGIDQHARKLTISLRNDSGDVQLARRHADGVKDHDLDHVVRDIIVRLLVSPCTFFTGWSGQPTMARFKLSVRTALLNNRGIAWTNKGDKAKATLDKAKAELVKAEQGE